MKSWGHLEQRFGTERPRKMLSIDGGGLRGIIPLEVLVALERMLAERTGSGGDFRLSDYFDYIAGTSTGSVVATCLALGMRAEEVLDFYLDLGPRVFDPESLARALADPSYHPFQDILQNLFGADADLASEKLKTLLMVVMHNNSTDSAWPLSSNPFAKYNDPARSDSNLRIPLWQLVRASTAYPGRFPPEEVRLDDGTVFRFDDGGLSPYINPAFQLFKMATAPEYRLGWHKGERELLLVSLGTGTAPHAGREVYASFLSSVDEQKASLSNFADIVMYGAQVDQDMNCRAVGRCTYGAPIDSELGDMIPRQNRRDGDGQGDLVPLIRNLGRSFLYARYDVLLSQKNLKWLGLDDIDAKAVQNLGALDQIENFRRIGVRVGQEIRPEHFGSFLP